MSDIDHVRALHLIQQRKRECLNMAVLDGLTSASISLAVAGGLSWSLQRGSPVSSSRIFFAAWQFLQSSKLLCI